MNEWEQFAVAADGTRLFYEVQGDAGGRALTVVLSDGIACDGFIWKYLRPALARTYRVLHWHYRGHGRSGSPGDPDRIDITAHAADLHAVLAHAGVAGPAGVALVGHSMGTQVCLEAYRQDPARVAAMVLICGSYGHITRTFHGTDVLLFLLPRALDLLRRYPAVARALWSRGPVELSIRAARLFGEVDALRIRVEDLRPYFEHVNHLDPEMFLRMVRAAGEHTAEDLLAAVGIPVLVVAGERDTFTPVRYAEQMARQIPGAEFLLVAEGSHTAPLEQPDVVDPAIERFLAERVDGCAAHAGSAGD